MLIGYHEKIGQWYKDLLDDMSASTQQCMHLRLTALECNNAWICINEYFFSNINIASIIMNKNPKKLYISIKINMWIFNRLPFRKIFIMLINELIKYISRLWKRCLDLYLFIFCIAFYYYRNWALLVHCLNPFNMLQKVHWP